MRGRDILDKAEQHIGERYSLGARAVFSNPDHRGPWDCAEFTSWCAYQTYGIVFGAYGSDPDTADAYSGKWTDDATRKGVLISVEDGLGTAGSFLLRKPNYHGISIGHVAISRGDGSTVEARSAAHGVNIFGSAASRPWSGGCVLPGVDYDRQAMAHAPDRRIIRLARPYMEGTDIRRVQERLAALGYEVGTIDGVYGPTTEAAVLSFQSMKGLIYDGEVGSETAGALGLPWPIT